MNVAPLPWSDPQPAHLLAGGIVRPVAIGHGFSAPRTGGHGELGRRVSGDGGCWEMARPVLRPVRGAASARSTDWFQLRLPLEDSDNALPGEILAERAAAICSWMADDGIVGETSCRKIRDLLIKELDCDEAPESLIVEIAKRHLGRMKLICNSPAVRLSRRKVVTPLSRVKQVDAACLRWLVRRPGESIKEWAGPRERILAVQRYRSTRTLENQVLLDALCRSRELAGTYLRNHGHHAFHKHVRLVRDAKRLVAQLAADEWAAEITPLRGVPVPNNTLLTDKRYSQVWRLWLRILRQDKVIQALESWLPRLTSQLLLVGCLAEVEDLRTACFSAARSSTLAWCGEFESGEFLEGTQDLPPLVTTVDGVTQRVDFIRGDQLIDRSSKPRLPTLLTAIGECRPDFCLYRRTESGSSDSRLVLVWSLAVWCAADAETLERELAVLDLRIRGLKNTYGDASVRAFVVVFKAGTATVRVPDLANVRTSIVESVEDIMCDVARLIVQDVVTTR